jgi:DNA (cytosine-5)-methyltransferase 1
MVGTMKLLDLFCGGGGGGYGYDKAGFEVVGVDIIEQPNYPFEFIQADALEIDLSRYDAIHASPPCQNYCWCTTKARNQGKTYPDLIEPVRKLLIASEKPYVIENVVGAPLLNPTYLEGTMFGLGVIRRRLFETNWWLPQPMYISRKGTVRDRTYCSVAGNGGDGSNRVDDWRKAMGINWMTRAEIKQAIPPAYTEYIGQYLQGVRI